MAQLKLSLLAGLDDLHRCTNSLVTADAQIEAEFVRFLPIVESLRLQWSEAVTECRRLQQALEKSHHDNDVLTGQVVYARKLLDQELKACKIAEREKRSLEMQLRMIGDVLGDQRNKLHEETREKLSFINQTTSHNGIPNNIAERLDTIAELDSTGSLLSDMSYSRSEDDLDLNSSFLDTRKDFKKCNPAPADIAPSPKRRRSNVRKSLEVRRSDLGTEERVVATTTVTVQREGNIKARSKIETKPSGRPKPASDLFPSAPPISIVVDSTTSDSSSGNNNNWTTPRHEKMSMKPPASVTRSSTLDISPSYGMNRKNMNTRPHNFVHKTSICPESCNYCGKRLKFGKYNSKCQDCRASCHLECEGLLPLPCVPVGNTPAVKGAMGTIADYTPMTSPMVPSIIVHCIREIESRGLNEIGIYRVPGAEREVKALKENFLRGKGAPNLSNVDVHVLCGTVKDFLRSLREPLILRTYWHDFVNATQIPDPEDAQAALFQAISELPQPNRDTLATLILHLQHVAECPECKMPISNLSKIFGPTIVGYSTTDPEPEVLLSETKKQATVVDQLLRLPADYWANFAHPSGIENRDPECLSHTPSTGSLLAGARNFLGNTPRSVRGKKKFFATPPAYK